MISTCENRREEIKNLIKTIYFVTKDNLLFKCKKLCSLQQLNETELGQDYLENKDCKTFLQEILSNFQQKLQAVYKDFVATL